MPTLLVELLTEELPPKALKNLGSSFGKTLFEALVKQSLTDKDNNYSSFATPRRIAVSIEGVESKSPDKQVNHKLVPKKIGWDDNGAPSTTLLKKLDSLGLRDIDPNQIEAKSDGKMEFLYIRHHKSGISLSDGLQFALDEAIRNLPIPKVMSYQVQDSLESVNFVRPAHSLVAIHDKTIVPVKALGLNSGNTTRGHRFHSDKNLVINKANHYQEILQNNGFVVPDFEIRRSMIEKQLLEKSDSLGLFFEKDDALLDEVTGLVEWPVVYIAEFDREFLDIPRECLILTMKTNQKYIPLFNDKHELVEKFLLVSNMEISDPANIIEGNEKVIRPRLADAQFFYTSDINRPLSDLTEKLSEVIYHNQLGTQLERVERIKNLAEKIGKELGADLTMVTRAALLCKGDLLSGMVGEFPELQGTMGRHYALAQHESREVATAIEEHYLPRFQNDAIPCNRISISLALSDKLDTTIGIFGIGLVPTGDKDPFALRRHTIGVIRILLENSLAISLDDLLEWTVHNFSKVKAVEIDKSLVKHFFLDRLKGYLKDRKYRVEQIEAALATDSSRLDLIIPRLDALKEFCVTEASLTLIGANKRIKNVLKKHKLKINEEIDISALTTDEERKLYTQIQELKPKVEKAMQEKKYAEALKHLALTHKNVDDFFTHVMVMSENPIERQNRISILSYLSKLLNCVGDLSELSVATNA